MDAAVFGLIVADLIARPMDQRDPLESGGLRRIESIELHPGGNVPNVSIAMAKLGMKAAACGVVGDDALGAIVSDRVAQAGVDVSSVAADKRAQTSATVVAVQPDGERCFFHTTGATSLLESDAFRRCFPIFRNCAWLHIGYFGLLPSLTPQLPGLFQELRSVAPNTRIALDTVNPPAPRDLLDPILPNLHLLAPSRPEAIALTGEKKPEKMVASFRSKMPQGIIAIKLDAQGCFLDDGDKQFTVPAYKVDVIDSTGAGDCWFAGLLAGLRKNMPLEKCGRLANRVAADCCTALGATTGVKSFEETVGRM